MPDLKPFNCLKCGKNLNSTTVVNDEDESRPKEGDYSICFYCGNIAVYNKEQTIDELTVEEQEEIMKTNKEIREVVTVILLKNRLSQWTLPPRR